MRVQSRGVSHQLIQWQEVSHSKLPGVIGIVHLLAVLVLTFSTCVPCCRAKLGYAARYIEPGHGRVVRAPRAPFPSQFQLTNQQKRKDHEFLTE